jgi:hypothetical protein
LCNILCAHGSIITNMLQRYKIFPLILLLAIFVNSCDDDPSPGSNGVPNSITGKVRLINADTEIPLDDHSGVQVSIEGTGFSTTSNAAGEYTFEDVPPGVYVLTFAKPEFDSAITGVEYSGVGVEFVNSVTMRNRKKIHRLEGFALLRMPFDSILDHSGITVSIDGTALTTSTDVNGKYTFTDPPRGQLNIKFTKTGFESTSLGIIYSEGVEHLGTAYLFSQSWISLDSMAKGLASDFVGSQYADSLSAGLVYFGGVGVPTYRPVLIVLGRTKDIPHQDVRFELMAHDTQTVGMDVRAFARKSYGATVMLALDWGYVIEYDKYFKDAEELVKLTADVFGRRITSNSKALPPR